MKVKFSPTVVGAFVLGAVTLGVIALLAFGGLHLFTQPQRFMVYFDESVHGLDFGSAVKLRGVRIGRVVDLSVRYDPRENRSEVGVVCELSRDIITDYRGIPIDVSTQAALQILIERGLRAKLGVVGLATGLLYVELNFVNPREYPAQQLGLARGKYVVMPAMPSAISEYQASLTVILSNLKKVDFGGLSEQVKKLLETTAKQLDGADVKGLLGQWKDAGAAVKDLASSPDAKQMFANLNSAIGDLRDVLKKIDTQVNPAGENLNATLKEARAAIERFNAAAASAQHFIQAQSWIGDQGVQTLQQLGDAADAVRRLADFLERNPNALLVGKKTEP